MSKYTEGLALFNAGKFFDAHEVLEDVWREAHGRRRRFLQSVIQIAVGLHHHSTGNLRGARSLLARASRGLEPYRGEYGGIDVAALLDAIALWRAALDSDHPTPPLPKIKSTNSGW